LDEETNQKRTIKDFFVESLEHKSGLFFNGRSIRLQPSRLIYDGEKHLASRCDHCECRDDYQNMFRWQLETCVVCPLSSKQEAQCCHNRGSNQDKSPPIVVSNQEWPWHQSRD
jgi:hypothetical protein